VQLAFSTGTSTAQQQQTAAAGIITAHYSLQSITHPLRLRDLASICNYTKLVRLNHTLAQVEMHNVHSMENAITYSATKALEETSWVDPSTGEKHYMNSRCLDADPLTNALHRLVSD